jgi:hypothetical protein
VKFHFLILIVYLTTSWLDSFSFLWKVPPDCPCSEITEKYHCIFHWPLAVLMALVLSVIRKLPNSLCLGRIHGRTCGCNGSLLKVREGKYKGGMVGTDGIWR